MMPRAYFFYGKIMAITSSSSYEDVRDEYLDNLSYDANDSLSEAKLFRAACRAILVFAQSSKHGAGGGEEVEFNLDIIQKQLEEANAWIASHPDNTSGAGNVAYVDFREASR
jgi:hypothetical protein